MRDPIEKGLASKLVDLYQANWSEFQKLFGVVEPSSEILSNLFLRSIWYQSLALASRQAEEYFCDQIGLGIFGESFLYAFLYLICPNLGERAPNYPALADRVKALEHGASVFTVPVPTNYAGYFVEPTRNYTAKESFVIKMADVASKSFVSEICISARDYLSAAGTARPTDTERDRIALQFMSLSPVGSVKTLGDIINAGWKIRVDTSCWSDYGFDRRRRGEVLNDLVFKTIEVMEFELRVGSNA